jgi:hypothetical protein
LLPTDARSRKARKRLRPQPCRRPPRRLRRPHQLPLCRDHRRRPPPTNRVSSTTWGRWWDGSISYLHDKIKAAPGTFEDIGKKSGDAAKGAAVATGEGMKKTFDVSKDAATTIVRLPNTRVIEVHERCATAANGAPDCAAAATSACRSKGFSGGKPLDSRTGEACPDTALASGKVPAKGECPLETVVLRAVCQ